jgi:peroxiredoxin
VAEPLENIKAWVEEHGLSYPVISDVDGTAFREYSNGSVPYNVVIDRKFKVRYSGNDFDENRFLKTISDLLK